MILVLIGLVATVIAGCVYMCRVYVQEADYLDKQRQNATVEMVDERTAVTDNNYESRNTSKKPSNYDTTKDSHLV